MRPGRLMLEWWLVALLSTGLVVLLVASHVTGRLDNVVYDGFLRAAWRTPRSDIAIVAIDNRSLAEAGAWPWPRARHAALIDRIAAAGPRAIAYDVLFVEPTTPEDDAKLGAAIAKTRVFVPFLTRIPGTNGATFDVVEPIAPVRAAAKGVGHVNLKVDDDGLVRGIAPLVVNDQQRGWPHLMELMRRAANAGAAPPNSESLIAFAGPPGQFPTASAAAVLRGEVPAGFFSNKLVLVGATAEGLGDVEPVPSGAMPGVEIQANMLDAMLAGRMFRPASTVTVAVVSLVPLWLLLLAFLRLPPRNTVLLLVLLLAAVATAVAVAMLAGHLWLPPTAALAGLALVYPLWGWRRLSAISAYMVDELERLRIEPDWLARPAPRVATTDLVGRQASLLQGAIARMEDMRQFVLDRLQQMPDGTFVTDTAGRIVLCNQEAASLCAGLGIAPDGKICPLLDRLHSLNPDEPAPHFPPADPAGLRWECALADGRSFDLRIVPQQARDGERIGWIVRAIDTSEARAAERQREDVLRLLSHDMRSPQTSIIAALDTAGEQAIAPPLAGRIRAHAMRTLDLADGFVQLARAESMTYELALVDLGDVLIEAVDHLWEVSQRRGVTVTADAIEPDLVVAGDRSLLTRALGNLIDNAIKYGGDGERVTCRLWRDGDQAVCTIEDHGPGIAPDEIARLFEQFRRAPGTGARRVEGTGLGLAFVHTVATRHGGSITCESVPGEHTTFTLTLPLIAG